MIKYLDFCNLGYEEKKDTLIKIFKNINQKLKIENEDFIYLLENVKEIKNETLDMVYKKLFDLKDKDKDTSYLTSEIKHITDILKNDIKEKKEDFENILDSID